MSKDGLPIDERVDTLKAEPAGEFLEYFIPLIDTGFEGNVYWSIAGAMPCSTQRDAEGVIANYAGTIRRARIVRVLLPSRRDITNNG